MDEEEEFESIIIGNDGDEGREEKSESLRLKRLQYYQNYTQHNHPDNPDSSDDEGNQEKRNERGSIESKSAADDNSDFDDFDEVENQYAPLDEGGYALEEDQEEFGDFVTTNVTLESRMLEIDSMLSTDNPDDLEKNMMFNRLLGEDRRYIRSVPSSQHSNNVEKIEAEADANIISCEGDQETRKQDQKDPEPSEPTSYRSIAPLTQEKVQKIKDIMAGIKINPPSSIGTLALLDSLERSRMRLGDELSSSEK